MNFSTLFSFDFKNKKYCLSKPTNMGIDTNWKKIIIEQFPECIIDNYDDLKKKIEDSKVTCVHDGSLLLYSSCMNARTGNELKENFKQSLYKYNLHVCPKSQETVVLFDEDLYKIHKTEAYKKRNKNPYTPEEIKKLEENDIILDITDGLLPDADNNGKRALDTPFLNSKMICYLTKYLWGVPCPFREGESGSKTLPDISEPFTLHIDGGRREKILPDGKKDRYQTEVIDIICKRERRNLNPKCEVIPFSESRKKIGEADIKLVYYLHKVKTHTIFISHDTDSIPILLLALRDKINPKTGVIDHHIFLDLSRTFFGNDGKTYSLGNKILVVDMVELWRRIILYFKENFWWIYYPIESFCFLNILTGTDYTSNFKDVAAKTVWKKFSKEGGGTTDFVLVVNGKANENPHSLFREYNEVDIIQVIKTNSGPESYGRVNEIEILEVREDRIWSFIERCYDYKESKYPSTIQARRALIRRCVWVLIYWRNGAKNFQIPHLCEIENGKSKWGWCFSENKIITTDNILF